MQIPLIPVAQFQLFLIVLARVTGFVTAIPIFSSVNSPVQFKIGLSVGTTLVLFPVMSQHLHVGDFQLLPLVLLLINESLLGAMIGLVSLLIFTAVEFGATVVGYQMGFAAANVFDPTNQKQIALVSQFQNVFAILLFLTLDGHHIFFKLAVRSYELLPPGRLNLSGQAVPYLMDLARHMFVLGVQFCAPVLAVVLLSGLILGILARVFPQLNVFLLSFPINIGVSFIVIALTLDFAAALLRREFDTLGFTLTNLLQLLN